MYQKLFLLLCSICLWKNSIAQTCPEIIGYYPNWQWYDRGQLVKPTTIQYSKYSILNYAFFKPETNGSISSTDAWADQNLLLGQINWSTTPISYVPNTSIIDRAHLENTKVLPSIGGWTLSHNFPSIASDPVKRTLFAHHCCELIRTYNFDGIDIDWEYPGYSPHNGTVADKVNYTLLLQQIRDSLNTLGLQNSKTYLLTTCIGASRANMLNIEWNNVQNIVDYINLMSYDFFGSWDPVANHNAPLFAPSQGDTTFNLHAAVSYLINHYQVPPTKLAAGVAFYGRSAKTTGAPSLFAPITGVDQITFGEDDGTPMYYNVLKKQNLFTTHWDSIAKVPYLTGNGTLNTFVSYDNPESIALKANYIKNHNLGGVIIWEITGDYLETAPGSGVISATPLIDTLRAVLCTNNSSASITPSGTVYRCPNQSQTLTATAGFAQYAWSTGETTPSINVASSGLYTATVTNAAGSSFVTNTVNVISLACQFPVNRSVQNITQTQAVLTWHTSACGLRYKVRYRINGSVNWNYMTETIDTTVVLTGLSGGTLYEWEVQTWCDINGLLTSAFSPLQTFITVASGVNLLPTVSITSPANNSIFTNGTSLNVNITANDLDGSVQYVKLLINNTLFGVDSTSPYTFNLVNSIPGTYTISARAFDNLNDSSNSVPVQIQVVSNSSCLYPQWQSTSVYNANDTVAYNGIVYRAKWWTMSNVPSLNYGNCCVWQYLMPCGGFTSSTCYRPVYDSLIAYNPNDQVYVNGVVYKAKWWTLNQHPLTHSGPTDVWMIDTTVSCDIVLHLKLFLEGYYLASGYMRPVLYLQGIDSNPASALTDTVTIELHQANAPFGLVYSSSGVVAVNGLLNVTFPAAVTGGSYYIVVKHRHTLETWSAEPVVISSSLFDFTNAATKAYGANQTQIEPNVYALYAGDLSQEGNIDLMDAAILEYDLNQFLFGYYASDINGDGNIDLLDTMVQEENVNAFIYTMHP